MLTDNIKEISLKEFHQIMDSVKEDKYSPLGKFYLNEKNETFTAIDNSTGDAWVESFADKESCFKYLNGFEFDEPINNNSTIKWFFKLYVHSPKSNQKVALKVGFVKAKSEEEALSIAWRDYGNNYSSGLEVCKIENDSFEYYIPLS